MKMHRRDAKPPARRNKDRDLRDSPRASQHSSLIYGVLPVLEALRADNRRVDKVLIAQGAKEKRLSEIVDLCRSRVIAFQWAPRETFAKYLDAGINHQGVLAFTSAANYAETDEILGAILRVAECSAVDGVIIPERRAVGLTDTVGKASAGAIEYVKVAKTANLNRLIEDLKERNIWVVGTSVDAKMDHYEWDWTRPSALVLGGEGKGLHRLVAENCDVLVKIPMYGRIDSLNVSVAAGVILFEARRQRKA